MKLSWCVLTGLALGKDARFFIFQPWEPTTWSSCAEAGLGDMTYYNINDNRWQVERLTTYLADDGRSGTFTQGRYDFNVQCQDWYHYYTF